MIITGGKFKGRKLKTPKGDTTRPSSALIKESLFNIIQNDIYDSIFVDMFAGTGSVGIEAISRGAKRSVFIELDKNNAAILKENLALLELQNQSEVINVSIDRAINLITPDNYDFIFIDPPYGLLNHDFLNDLFYKMLVKNIIASQTQVILQSSAKFYVDRIENTPLELIKKRKYGKSLLSFWKQKKTAEG